jgi:hypothetical protein
VPTSLTPEQRSHRARIAAHVLHGSRDSAKHTEPARKAFLERFELEALRQAEAAGEILSAEEVTRRAGHLKKAHMYRLALASSKARARGGDAA